MAEGKNPIEVKGKELTEAQLDKVAGGNTTGPCPQCGGWNFSQENSRVMLCRDCGWSG